MPYDTPTIVRGVQDDYRRLYYSDHNAALKIPITLAPGYGLVKAGSILAKNLSAATTGSKGKFVPYNPTTFTGAEDHPGRAYLVADVGASASVCYVTIADSYKFKVGDDLIINDDETSAENLGAITAIDRTSEQHRAKLTFTTQTSGTFTNAAKGHVFVEAGTSGNNYSDAVGVLEKTVDTGTGENAKGANATLILSNCVLYAGCMPLLDAASKTDLSATEIGQFVVIK